MTMDARHNNPRHGRVLMATIRDAADVAVTTSFGAAEPMHFYVEQRGERGRRPRSGARIAKDFKLNEILRKEERSQLTSQLTLTINGQPRTLTVPPMKRLLDLLREDLRLTGTKEGCGEGECGSCSVLFNGALVNSCLVPALQAQGAQVTTIEGLAHEETLHPIQQCFLEEGGAQCGICTPGMVLATHHLLQKYAQPTLAQIQEGLAGNLCRCTGYMRIFAAVQSCANKSSPPGGASCTSTSTATSPSSSASSPS